MQIAYHPPPNEKRVEHKIPIDPPLQSPFEAQLRLTKWKIEAYNKFKVVSLQEAVDSGAGGRGGGTPSVVCCDRDERPSPDPVVLRVVDTDANDADNRPLAPYPSSLLLQAAQHLPLRGSCSHHARRPVLYSVGHWQPCRLAPRVGGHEHRLQVYSLGCILCCCHGKCRLGFGCGDGPYIASHIVQSGLLRDHGISNSTSTWSLSPHTCST